jgi:hypothetical protein
MHQLIGSAELETGSANPETGTTSLETGGARSARLGDALCAETAEQKTVRRAGGAETCYARRRLRRRCLKGRVQKSQALRAKRVSRRSRSQSLIRSRLTLVSPFGLRCAQSDSQPAMLLGSQSPMQPSPPLAAQSLSKSQSLSPQSLRATHGSLAAGNSARRGGRCRRS